MNFSNLNLSPETILVLIGIAIVGLCYSLRGYLQRITASIEDIENRLGERFPTETEDLISSMNGMNEEEDDTV